MNVFSEIVGWIGAGALMGAYLLVSMGWIRPGYRFQGANLLGSLAFAIYGIFRETWPTVATNSVWLLISVIALVRLRQTQQRSAGNSRACELTGLGGDLSPSPQSPRGLS